MFQPGDPEVRLYQHGHPREGLWLVHLQFGHGVLVPNMTSSELTRRVSPVRDLLATEEYNLERKIGERLAPGSREHNEFLKNFHYAPSHF
jgi:hypothetical protein